MYCRVSEHGKKILLATKLFVYPRVLRTPVKQFGGQGWRLVSAECRIGAGYHRDFVFGTSLEAFIVLQKPDANGRWPAGFTKIRMSQAPETAVEKECLPGCLGTNLILVSRRVETVRSPGHT